jgi:hypothetical protein
MGQSGKAWDWALRVGLALTLENARRTTPGLRVRIPSDPFSDLQLRASLGSVATQIQNLGEIAALRPDAGSVARAGCLPAVLYLLTCIVGAVIISRWTG